VSYLGSFRFFMTNYGLFLLFRFFMTNYGLFLLVVASFGWVWHILGRCLLF